MVGGGKIKPFVLLPAPVYYMFCCKELRAVIEQDGSWPSFW